MNLLYTCDNNYIRLMSISVISLFENNQQIKNLVVYLLGENISNENKAILDNIGAKYGRKIIVIDLPKIDIPDILISTRWPLSAFTRLFSAQLLPRNLDRILYVDCDTIIKGDIESLLEIDIYEKIFYGISDCISLNYKRNIGLQPNSVYINAGVLLINLEKLRDVDIKRSIDKYLTKYIKLMNYADQDILNSVFTNQIGVLSPQYNIMTLYVSHTYQEICMLRKPTNFYSASELETALINPIIIHYTTNMRVIRPWFKNTNHPLAAEFSKYMSLSPWKSSILPEMKFKSIEERFIGIVQKLPKGIACRLLGLIHSDLKPIYIRLKATKAIFTTEEER